jgi:hypothetical protein
MFCAQPLIELLPAELSFEEASNFFSQLVQPLIHCLLEEDKPLLNRLHSKLLGLSQRFDQTQANQLANDILVARDFYLLRDCTDMYHRLFSNKTKLEILRNLPIGGLSHDERPEYYEAQRAFFDIHWKAWSSDFSEKDFQTIKENPYLLSDGSYLRPLCIQNDRWALKLPSSSDAPATT